MSARLHLADADDMDRLLPLVAAYHDFAGIRLDHEARAAALRPLLEGSERGAIWLIGPRRAPVGYIALAFGWSIGLGGMDGRVDEFYIRESVRGRGMGTEVLVALLPQLAAAGLKALHLELDEGNDSARRVYAARGFRMDESRRVMTWRA